MQHNLFSSPDLSKNIVERIKDLSYCRAIKGNELQDVRAAMLQDTDAVLIVPHKGNIFTVYFCNPNNNNYLQQFNFLVTKDGMIDFRETAAGQFVDFWDAHPDVVRQLMAACTKSVDKPQIDLTKELSLERKNVKSPNSDSMSSGTMSPVLTIGSPMSLASSVSSPVSNSGDSEKSPKSDRSTPDSKTFESKSNGPTKYFHFIITPFKQTEPFEFSLNSNKEIVVHARKFGSKKQFWQDCPFLMNRLWHKLAAQIATKTVDRQAHIVIEYMKEKNKKDQLHFYMDRTGKIDIYYSDGQEKACEKFIAVFKVKEKPAQIHSR